MNKKAVDSKLYASSLRLELEHAIEFVETVKANVAQYLILNLFAPTGFGKTMLLEDLWKKYERILPTSLVRVRDFQSETFDLCGLLIHVIHDLGDRVPKRVAGLPADYEDSKDKEWLAERLLLLVSGARDFEKATLLLFDDYDYLPENIRRWFESEILTPLVKAKSAAMILTSERGVRFNAFDLRMRLESRELSSLSTGAISEALPEYNGIAGEIHRISGGVPLLTEELVKQLRAAEVTVTDFRSRRQELVREFYRTHLKETIFKNTPQEIQETILVLALLRRFDVKVMGRILPIVLPRYYETYTTPEYLNLIERPLKSWAQWRMQGGYALKSAYRVLLPEYVWTEDPNLYEQVNRVAVASHRGLLKTEGYREYYLLELLYHRLVLDRIEGKDRAAETRLGDELQKYLGDEDAASIQAVDLDALRNSLKQDIDLKDYVSEGILRMIQDLIDKKTEGIPVILDAENRWIHLVEGDGRRQESVD
ncbi:MAG: hypothetical protein SXV54_20130 [Chloroflexota bacterium]|nr:hypothetical protein [Chloroflexota bacterium]